MFAAGTYKMKEMVTVNGERITLPQYANRMNIKLLRPADFNAKLRERGVERKATVQKICRACKDEKDVRTVLDGMWQSSFKAQEVLKEALTRNSSVFEFERTLA